MEREKPRAREERERDEGRASIPSATGCLAGREAEDDVDQGRCEDQPEVRGTVLPVGIRAGLDEQQNEPCERHGE